MKKILTIFFVTLGVIFLIVIMFGVYFFVVDPMNLKPILFGQNENAQSIEPRTSEDKNPMLNETQEATLEKIGIDPANVPTEITPEQEACFIEMIGFDRVEQIKAGDTPSALEILKGQTCL